MNINNQRPFFGDHLYNAGLPSKNIEEKIADTCLLFPNQLSDTLKITVIKEDSDLRIDYIQRGCIHQLFDNAIASFEHSPQLQDVTMIPAFFAIGVIYMTTCIVAKPLELIGKCMKNIALEMNPKAKDYNQLAANHIQFLQTHNATLDRVSALKTALESRLLTIQIYTLVLEKTKCQQEGFLKVELELDSTIIPLILKPIVKDGCIEDYEISAPVHSVLSLPTTRNELGRYIQSQDNILNDLENEFLAKLKLFQRGSANFENAVETLLKEEKTEHTYLLT